MVLGGKDEGDRYQSFGQLGILLQAGAGFEDLWQQQASAWLTPASAAARLFTPVMLQRFTLTLLHYVGVKCE